MPPKKAPTESVKAQAASPAGATALMLDYPGAFGLFKSSKEAMVRIFGTIVLLYLIILAIDIVTSIITGVIGLDNSIRSLIYNIISGGIQIVAIPMWTYIMLRSVYGYRETVGTALEYARPNILRFFLASLLAGLAMVGGLLLFIIPGIIFAMRFSMTNYILVDNPELDAVEAMRRSWRMTKGNLSKIWGIVGVTVLMFIPVITIIGIIPAIILLYFYAAAGTILYTYLKQQPVEPIAAPTPQPAVAAK